MAGSTATMVRSLPQEHQGYRHDTVSALGSMMVARSNGQAAIREGCTPHAAQVGSKVGVSNR